MSLIFPDPILTTQRSCGGFVVGNSDVVLFLSGHEASYNEIVLRGLASRKAIISNPKRDPYQVAQSMFGEILLRGNDRPVIGVTGASLTQLENMGISIEESVSWFHDFYAAVRENRQVKGVISAGQSGVQQACLAAAVHGDIPATAIVPTTEAGLDTRHGREVGPLLTRKSFARKISDLGRTLEADQPCLL